MKTRTIFGDIYKSGRPGRNAFALTFDDGPLPGATERVLDILHDYNATATFFVIGRLVEQSPAIVKRIFDDGHLVANHTYDHSRWGMWRGPFYWGQQIDQCDVAIERVIGERPLLFRPPYGVRTPVNVRVLRSRGHANVMWSRRARDGIPTTADKIFARLTRTIDDGDVLLLHDGREPASTRDVTPTIDALPRVIEAYYDRGLRTMRLDELLGVPAYRRDSNTALADMSL